MKIKSNNRLEQIFDATLRQTGKVGIAGLKMSNIAKEAKMASGTLYLYFNSKEELLNSLYYKLQKESAPSIINEISHLSIEVQLYKMWTIALKKLVDDNFRVIFIEQFLISPFISKENKEIDTSFKKYIKGLLEKGKDEHVIKDIDSDYLLCLIIGYLRNFSSYIHSEKNGELTEELIDKSYNLCWEAIRE